MEEIARNNAEFQKVIAALKQELISVGSIREQLAGLNAALKINQDESQKENAQLNVRLRLIDSLQQEVPTIRTEMERRRSETEDMKMKAADITGQIKILREQLKLKRNGFK